MYVSPDLVWDRVSFTSYSQMTVRTVTTTLIIDPVGSCAQGETRGGPLVGVTSAVHETKREFPFLIHRLPKTTTVLYLCLPDSEDRSGTQGSGTVPDRLCRP